MRTSIENLLGIEAQGSIELQLGGNAKLHATDPAAEKDLEVGWWVSFWSDALARRTGCPSPSGRREGIGPW
jgi:hypothetical protein